MNAKSNKHNGFVHRPEFNTIGSLYDDLSLLTDKYGFEQVILHLGEIARNAVTRDLAGKIWSILNIQKRVEPKRMEDSE